MIINLIFGILTKKNSNVKTFDIRITYEEFISLFVFKEEEFYNNMKYNPSQLIGSKKLWYKKSLKASNIKDFYEEKIWGKYFDTNLT